MRPAAHPASTTVPKIAFMRPLTLTHFSSRATIIPMNPAATAATTSVRAAMPPLTAACPCAQYELSAGYAYTISRPGTTRYISRRSLPGDTAKRKMSVMPRLHTAPRDWVSSARPTRPVASPMAAPRTGAGSSGPAASQTKGQNGMRKRAEAAFACPIGKTNRLPTKSAAVSAVQRRTTQPARSARAPAMTRYLNAKRARAEAKNVSARVNTSRYMNVRPVACQAVALDSAQRLEARTHTAYPVNSASTARDSCPGRRGNSASAATTIPATPRVIAWNAQSLVAYPPEEKTSQSHTPTRKTTGRAQRTAARVAEGPLSSLANRSAGILPSISVAVFPWLQRL